MIEFSDKSVRQIIISLLLIASTFVAIPLNGGEKGYIYVNAALRELFSGRNASADILYETLYRLLILSNMALFLMPVLVLTRYRKAFCFFVPLVYLVLTIAYFPLAAPLCIPFLGCWISLWLQVRKP